MTAAKSDAATAPSKQELIVGAACKLFLGGSYDGISMDAIAAEAGVSKATVYSHFQNKESLFAGVMHMLCEQSQGPKVDDGLCGPPEQVLRMMGLAIAGRSAAPEMVALLRTVLSGVAQFPEVGRTFWEDGPGRAQEMLAHYFTELAQSGKLHVPDPQLAAMHFIGLVTGPFLLPMLLGASQPATTAEVERSVDRAVELFLAGLPSKSG